MNILAVSWASHTSVNRHIFRVLGQQSGVGVSVVIPKNIRIGGVSVDCDSFVEEDINVISLAITHGNPRYNRYVGIYDVLRNLKPDIIYHEDDPISFQALQYGIWCFLNNKILICRTNQNTSIRYKDEIKRLGFFKGTIYASLKLSVSMIVRKFVYHIFAISNDGVNIYKKLGYKNVTKIPLGFDEQLFKVNASTRELIRSNLGIEGIVFSYVGRVIEGKGLHILLEALSRIKNHEWTLLLDNFSIGPQTTYQQRITEYIDDWALKDRIVSFEADHEEIANYMNASDVVIVPSITTSNFKEQYGRVAPESMAWGCLVIASKSGTLPELVQDAGWLFEEGNINELEQLLIKAIKLRDREYIRYESERYAHQHLGVEAQKMAMMEVISKFEPAVTIR